MHAWDAAAPAFVALALVWGYFCGSVPFGLLLTKSAGMGDVRAIGSGNIGATNVLRTGRKDLAAATLVLDALKGTFAVLVARAIAGGDCGTAAALGAFCWPYRPGLAAVSRRQGRRDLSGRADRACLARCNRICRRLARGRGSDPLFIGSRVVRKRRLNRCNGLSRPWTRRGRSRAHGCCSMLDASREHPPSPRRNGKPHRRQGVTMASKPSLDDAEKLDWLHLIRCDNVGPRTFRTLLNKFGSARAALDALPDLLRRQNGERAIRIAPRDAVEREWMESARRGIRFIALGEQAYPEALRAIDAAPPLLAVRGQVETLSRPSVAIVGSRNASGAGLAFAERITRGLSERDYVTVSGLARGIDAVVHRASLSGGTVAVLAGGHAKPYPPEHAALADAICETGAVVSEMPLAWEPRGRDFPRRKPDRVRSVARNGHR